MDKKYNFIAGIICYLMAIMYLLLRLYDGNQVYTIGFIFWALSGFFSMDTYKNKKRNGK